MKKLKSKRTVKRIGKMALCTIFVCMGLNSVVLGAKKGNNSEFLPTGVEITPTAAPGAVFQTLNPNLPSNPDFVVGQAVATSISPDGNSLLILTSGYNRNNDVNGQQV